MTRNQILLALLPPLFFGTGFTIAKPAVTHFPPLFMMLLIYGGIALVLAFSHRERIRTPLFAVIAISAFAVTIQGALMFTGLRGMPATAANLILQIQIPFAVLLDWLIGGERLNFRRTLGMAIAFLGVALVIGLPEEPPPFGAAGLMMLPILSFLMRFFWISVRNFLFFEVSRTTTRPPSTSGCDVPEMTVKSLRKSLSGFR